MHEKPDISDAALFRHLRDSYDVGAGSVEFLPLGAVVGCDGFAAPMAEDQWVRLGTALCVIHNAWLPRELLSHIRAEAYSSQWRDKLRAYLAPRAVDRLADDYAEELAQILHDRHRQLAEILARAEHLASSMRVQATPRRHLFCHSDIHARAERAARQDRALTLRYFNAQFEPGDVIEAADQAYAAFPAP